MYAVTLYGRNGAERVYTFNDINRAKVFIKQNLYIFGALRDSNGDIIYSAAYEDDDAKSTVFSFKMWNY